MERLRAWLRDLLTHRERPTPPPVRDGLDRHLTEREVEARTFRERVVTIFRIRF